MSLRATIRVYANKFRLDPDDLEQDIQIKLLTQSGKYRDTGSSYDAWVNRLVYNHCIDITRKVESRQRFVSQEAWHGHYRADMSFEQRQYIASILFKVRRTWPDNARLNTRLLWLWMTGWKIREIAEQLSIPEGTVKATIHRIRQIL